MNNTAPDFTKDNQYEFKCLGCGVTAYARKGTFDCNDCQGRTAQFRKMWDDLRWNTHSQISDKELAITAMHKAFQLGRADAMAELDAHNETLAQ